jgi:hypothetical protein
MTGASRHDPFVVLHDTAVIADAKRRRLDAADQAVRAAQMLTLFDVLAWSVTAGETVTIATCTAGQVSGVAVHVAHAFVVVEETRPVPRIVLVATDEIVTVTSRSVAVDEVGEATGLDDTTTLLTMLETSYRGDPIELTLRNGASVCAPVRLFGDEILFVALTKDTSLCVAGAQIALAAIPPPRRRDRSHTGG